MSFEITLSSDDSDGSRGYCSDLFELSPQPNRISGVPRIQIIDQPGDFRYRYEKEKYHGHILAQNSPVTKKKDMSRFPSIKVLNCQQDVIVRCWLISTKLDDRPTATFHKLARKLPKGQMKLEPHDFFASERNDYTVTFDYLYIIHAVMNDPNDVNIYEAKKSWLESGSYECPKYFINSPSQKEDLKNIDRNQSVLYFEVFDALTHEKLCDAVSRKIKNLHNPETGALKIVNYSRTFGTCRGGDEVFMFVEKISKDVEVRFFELKEGSDCERTWQAPAVYGPQHVHHQYGIVFRTPRFHNTSLKKDVGVFFELFRKTDGATSDPVKFTYKPDEPCRIYDSSRKRPHSPQKVCREDGNVLLSQCSVKKVREESMSPDSTSILYAQPQDHIDVFDEELLKSLGNEGWVSLINLESGIEGVPPVTMALLESFENLQNNTLAQESSDFPDLELLLENEKHRSDSINELKKKKATNKEMPVTQMGPAITIKKEMTNEISSDQVSSSSGEVEEDSDTSLLKLKEMVKLIRSEQKSLVDFVNLLDSVKNINDVDFNGNSIFLIASECSVEVLKVLLGRKDLDRSLKNLDGDNALLCATRSGRPDLVECLLAHDFDPNVQNYRSGETPLHIAVDQEIVPLVNILLKYGADPLIDNYGSQSTYDYSTNCIKEDLKKIIYEKAQELFSKKRSPRNKNLHYSHPPLKFDVTECDLVRELQTLTVSST